MSEAAPRGPAGRVAAVHRQARPTLALALGFALAAPVLAVVPHEGGAWLPLHVFLVGAVLLAISGATQLLAVTWSSAPAPPGRAVATQRALLAVGAAGLTAVRALDGPRPLAAASGTAVLVALVLLGWLLVRIRSTATLDRFRPAIDAYLVAIALGSAGSTAGIVLASVSPGRFDVAVRDAHLTANLLGLVGLVVLGTLPSFLATQARTKLSPRASAARLRAVAGVAALLVVGATAAHLADRPRLAAACLVAYGVAVAGSAALWPSLRRRHLDWAGPRLVQLLAGVVWWVVAAGLFARAAWRGEPVPHEAIATLVVGAYAQILTGSLAYFGPVLRGGDHRDLTAGFGATRSWTVLAAANVAAVASLTGRWTVLAAALAVWAAVAAATAIALVRARPAVRPEGPASAPAGPARAEAGRDRGAGEAR